MKFCCSGVGWMVVGAFSMGLPASGPAQDFNGLRSVSNAQSRGSTNVTGSRSVSFTKNGEKVSMTENASGVTVTVNGKTVRARNAAELKRRYPDAFRLYNEHMNAAQVSGRAFAGGSGSSGGGGGAGGPGNFRSESSQARSVSVMENGKTITISENKAGITVAVNGQRVRAKNAADLRAKYPGAYKLYLKHLGATNGRVDLPDAETLLQQELRKLRDNNANNPQLRALLDNMMRSVGQ